MWEQRRAKGRPVAAAVLADHFRSAEDQAKAFTYMVEAAETALAAYAFNNVIVHLNDALSLVPDDADDATRCRLWGMMGLAYGSSGRLDDAIVAYQNALNSGHERVGRQLPTTGWARRTTERVISTTRCATWTSL